MSHNMSPLPEALPLTIQVVDGSVSVQVGAGTLLKDPFLKYNPWYLVRSAISKQSIASIEFEVISLAGNVLLTLVLPQDETIAHVKEYIEDALPEAGPASTLLLQDNALALDTTLINTGLTSGSVLRVLFGLGSASFSFERGLHLPWNPDTLEARVNVCCGTLRQFEDDYAWIAASSVSVTGDYAVTVLDYAVSVTVKTSAKISVTGDYAVSVLDKDLRMMSTHWKHDIWTYSLALEAKPREAAYLKQMLRSAQEVLYFSYETDGGGAYSDGVEMLVDSHLLISLWSCVSEHEFYDDSPCVVHPSWLFPLPTWCIQQWCGDVPTVHETSSSSLF